MPYAKSKTRSHNVEASKNRNGLAKNIGKTDTFRGMFVKYGFSHLQRRILITGVMNSTGLFVAQHIWLPLTDELKDLNLAFGDHVEFQGTIVAYEKGSIESGMIYEDVTITDPIYAVKIGRANF